MWAAAVIRAQEGNGVKVRRAGKVDGCCCVVGQGEEVIVVVVVMVVVYDRQAE